MKALKIPVLVILLTLSTIFAGCIEISTLITVNNDGSGTVEETVMMSREIIDMLTEFQNSFASDTVQSEPFKFYNEEELKKNTSQFGEGVSYVSSREIKGENKEGYTAKYEFRNVNNLKINQNPNSRVKLESIETEPEVKEEFITFNFIKDKPSELRIQMPLEKKFEESEDTAVEDTVSMDTTGMTEQLTAIFKDLKFSLAVDVKGNITNTNAVYVDKNRITLFEINFAELISNAEKMREFGNAKPQNLEQVKEILKGIPGIKVEYNNQVFVKFE